MLALFALACAGERATPSHARRVVSLAPNVTEMIHALGAGDLLAGADDDSDFPARARTLPKVGPGLQPSIEKIVALRPDLVVAIAAGLHPNLSRALAAQQIPLLVVKSDRLDDVPAATRAIGRALGRDSAPAVEAMMQALARQRRARTRPPRILFAVWCDPLYVAGTETFTSDLFAVCGVRNAAAVHGWPQYSLESLLAAPPDLLLYPNRSVSAGQAGALVRRANLRCPVVPVDENVFVRPGPRMADAAAALNRIVDEWERSH